MLNKCFSRKLVLTLFAFLGVVIFLHKNFSGITRENESPHELWSPPEPEATYVEKQETELVPPAEPRQTTPRSRITLKLQEQLEWEAPVETKDHYPPYDQYLTRDYDPNRWEGFGQ